MLKSITSKAMNQKRNLSVFNKIKILSTFLIKNPWKLYAIYKLDYIQCAKRI